MKLSKDVLVLVVFTTGKAFCEHDGLCEEISRKVSNPAFCFFSMRCIGKAERALELMIARVTDPSRRTFGKNLAEHGTIVADIARSRIEIDQARFLVLNAAKKIDLVKAKGAMKEIGMAKVSIVIYTISLLLFPNKFP